MRRQGLKKNREHWRHTLPAELFFMSGFFFNLQTLRARPISTLIAMPPPRHWATFAGLWPIFSWQTRPERGRVALRELQLPTSHWHKEWCRTRGLCWDTAVIRETSLRVIFLQYWGGIQRQKRYSRKAVQQQMERKEIPNYSWLKFSKPLFYFFCMVTLLKILIARITTSFQKLLSLLIYTSCISWLKDNTIGKFRVGQLTIYALLHPT